MLTASSTVSIVRRHPSNPEMTSRPSTQCPRKIGRRFVVMNLSGASLRHSNDDNAIFETNYKKCDALKTEGNTYAKLEVDDPVQCGHLLAFCDSEFSSENLKFVMEVDRLRDYMQEDTVSWTRSWQDIDKELNLVSSVTNRDENSENDNQRTQIRNSDTQRNTCKKCRSQMDENYDWDIIKDCCVTSANSSGQRSPTQESETSVGSRSSRFMKITNIRTNFEIVEHPFSRIRDLHLVMADPKTTSKGNWPSKKVNQQVVEKMVKKIWDTYLSETSHLEICVSPLAIINTVRRISYLDLYGPDAFSEALLEPLRTIQMDILPRFFVSKVYLKMRAFQLKSNPLPSAKSIRVPPPKKSTTLSRFQVVIFEDKLFDLNEILQENFLYLEFLRYLEGIYCSESLLCVRMVLLFEEEVSRKNFSEALKLSWYICNYFVRAGAAFEISLVHLERKEILLNLATPNLFMFSNLKRTAIRSLEANFRTYTLTSSYRGLGKMLIRVRKQEESYISFLNRNVFVRLLPLIPIQGNSEDADIRMS